MAQTKRSRTVVARQTMADSSDDDEPGIANTRLSRAVKSKLAAKARRDQETVELASLCEELPFPGTCLDKLDKSSLIRLAITYIHTKTYIQKDIRHRLFKEPINNVIEGVTPISQKSLMGPVTGGGMVNCWKSHNKIQPQPPQLLQLQHPQQQLQPQQQERVEEGRLMLDSMQGFLIFVNKKGKILYISDNVEQHLGLKQVSLLGMPVMDIVHPGDLKELSKQFTIHLQKSNPAEPVNNNDPVSASTKNLLHSDQRRTFYIRMRFLLNKPGGKTKHSGYTLVQWTGRLKLRASSKASGYGIDGLICICRPVQSHSVLEIRLGGNMFMSRHDLGMKFTFCDPRILTLIGYEPCEVIGKTAYYFHYPMDAAKISDCHSNLIVKGTSVSKYYRFFGKNGDWVWMQTRATIIYNTSNRPQYVVCMNYVIGEDEGQRYLMMEEEQQGFRDPNVRGCIDLTNTSTESPVSSCCSGDDSHDDTGYSSGYSHCTESISSHTSPDTHAAESSDERDSVLDDYPMTDVSQTESLHKEPSDQVEQAVTAMSNGFDPFLSSFREELGFSEPAPGDGMDLLDDLLKSMEDEEQICPPQPKPVVITETPTTTAPQPGKRQSLLRSLLDKGDNIPSMSLMDYQYPSIASGPVFSSSSTSTGTNNVSVTNTNSKCAHPLSSLKSPTPTETKTSSSEGKQIESPMDVSQVEPFIPEDLLDFAMQYCESIADEQSQGVIPNYDQDLWSSSMDDLITTLADSQSSITTPVQSSPQNTATAGSQEVSYIDLDKVNTINNEHHYSCRTMPQCQRKQFQSVSSKGLSGQQVLNVFSNRNVSSTASRGVNSRCNEGVFTQHLKASSRATATQTATSATFVNGAYTNRCSTSPNSQKHCKSSASRTGQNRTHKSVSNAIATNGGQMKSLSVGYKDSRNGKSVIQFVSTGGQKSRGTVCSGVSPASVSTSSVTINTSGPTSTMSTAMLKEQTAPRSLQGMSELEKYLRGYVKRPHGAQQKQGAETLTLSKMSALPSGQTPFLQKLLTGELSHELYREIDSQMVIKERERRSSTHSLSDVIG